jgi:tetratricopeptide (TPR) repeat protein
MAESILKEDDRSAPAHLMLAQALLAQGHADEALPEARRAATFADLPEAHLALGQALETIGKLDQAVAEYQLARRPPVESEATLGRARIMVRMGATKDALAELTPLGAHAKDPNLRAQALTLSGDCYADLQQAERARHAYEDAVKTGPQLAEPAFKFARALHDAGRRRPAIDMAERAIKLGGDKASFAAEAQLLLGDAHREGKENADAVRAYKRYLELAPPDAPARNEVTKQISILGGG